MKKYIAFILVAIAFSVLPLHAGPVSPSRAMEIAEIVFNCNNGAAYGSLQIVWTGGEVTTKANENPPFYVIASSGGGFVIVAGDDNVRPVLALSEKNFFSVEDMPENVKWWMDDIANYVRSTTEQTEAVRDLWSRYTSTKTSAVTGTVTDKHEHLTPEWNQGNPYNRFCPLQDGSRTITGCVATALAEILTTESGLYPDAMPKKGTGEVGGYSVPSGSVSPAVYSLGTEYDWAGLRTLVNYTAISQASDALIDNMAHLMADCGALVHAQYSTSSTGAYSSYIPGEFAEHMGYNKRARMVYKRDYSKTQWERVLGAELDKHPVYHAANGHAFVFDGHGLYEGEFVIHVNFGWGGYCNGYYFPTSLDTGGKDYYSEWADIIFDFYPDPTSTYAYQISLGNWWNGTGLEAPSPVPVGQSFTLYCRGLSNEQESTYTGTIRVSLVDKDGVHKVDGIGSSTISGWGAHNGHSNYSISCTIPEGTKIDFGDKLILECTTNAEGTVFGPVFYVDNGSIVCEVPMTPTAFIRKADSYKKGDYFDFQLMNNNFPYAGTIWTITDPAGTVKVYPQSEGAVKLTQSGKYKIVAEICTSEDGEVQDTIATFIQVN